MEWFLFTIVSDDHESLDKVFSIVWDNSLFITQERATASDMERLMVHEWATDRGWKGF